MGCVPCELQRGEHAFELLADLGNRLRRIDDREAVRRFFRAPQVLLRVREKNASDSLSNLSGMRAAPRRSLATCGATSNSTVRSGWNPPCTQRSSVSSLSRGSPRPPPGTRTSHR